MSLSSNSLIIDNGPYAVIKIKIKTGIALRMYMRSMSVTFDYVRLKFLAFPDIDGRNIPIAPLSNLAAIHLLEEAVPH